MENATLEPKVKFKPKLLRKSEVAKLAKYHMEERAKKGGRKFTRISMDFYEALEGNMRNWIAHRVHSAPSVGKTLE